MGRSHLNRKIILNHPAIGDLSDHAQSEIDAIRFHLQAALDLMDKARSSSVSAARLQQIIDEDVDRDFGRPIQ